ncbi:MAG: hypothetical protein JWQ14_3366 [Adhaeribacter sp.]|jgi:hypothetical protein|nr:hypothetical protein [Adhaeribacter sp.]
MNSVEERTGKAMQAVMAVVGMMMIACTSARETNEYNATAPTTIQSDADRRAIYNNAGTTQPLSRPPNLNNRASEINRQKNIENPGTNNPNNKPPEVRVMEMGRPLPDTIR